MRDQTTGHINQRVDVRALSNHSVVAVDETVLAVLSLLVSGFDLLSDAGLLLKSVTYQPLPFNWKPAAEICLT
jgi:hypothetical protein